jgi:hypothetical protein
MPFTQVLNVSHNVPVSPVVGVFLFNATLLNDGGNIMKAFWSNFDVSNSPPW